MYLLIYIYQALYNSVTCKPISLADNNNSFISIENASIIAKANQSPIVVFLEGTSSSGNGIYTYFGYNYIVRMLFCYDDH